MNEETVTIPKEEYDNLKDDAKFLAALFKAGVDQWPGYRQAVLDQLDKV